MPGMRASCGPAVGKGEAMQDNASGLRRLIPSTHEHTVLPQVDHRVCVPAIDTFRGFIEEIARNAPRDRIRAWSTPSACLSRCSRRPLGRLLQPGTR